MNILIIDDDLNKRERIIEFIKSEYECINIVQKKSYQSALKEIFSQAYDMVLLDMTMPTFDIDIGEAGGRIRVFAGKEVMRKMIRRKYLFPVVIITQFERFGDDKNEILFDALKEELSSSYPEVFRDMIYYNAASSSWHDILLNHIKLIK